MFDRDEELNNIMTFSAMNIIRAFLQTLSPYELYMVRKKLIPHWSDGYQPSLDPFFNNTTCKLCGQRHILNRKEHFHSLCNAVKEKRNSSKSLGEFEEKLNE